MKQPFCRAWSVRRIPSLPRRMADVKALSTVNNTAHKEATVAEPDTMQMSSDRVRERERTRENERVREWESVC